MRARLSPADIPHKTAITWLFAALLVWQPLQYVFIAEFGEPYPAITMPGFGDVPADSNGVVHITNVEVRVVFDDNSVAWTSMHALLPGVPASHHMPIVQHMFSPRADSSARSSSGGLKRRIMKAFFPGAAASRERSVETIADVRTVQWLNERVRALYPTRRPKAVAFVWYRDEGRLGQQVEHTREVSGTYEVPLDGI